MQHMGPLSYNIKKCEGPYLNTYWIPLHAVEIGVVGGGRVEELPPQQLAKQGQRRTAAFPQLVKRGEKKQFSTRVNCHISTRLVGNICNSLCYLHVELSQVVVKNPAGQAAEAEVGAEAGGTGVQ